MAEAPPNTLLTWDWGMRILSALQFGNDGHTAFNLTAHCSSQKADERVLAGADGRRLRDGVRLSGASLWSFSTRDRSAGGSERRRDRAARSSVKKRLES